MNAYSTVHPTFPATILQYLLSTVGEESDSFTAFGLTQTARTEKTEVTRSRDNNVPKAHTLHTIRFSIVPLINICT